MKSWDKSEVFYTRDCILATSVPPYYFYPQIISPVTINVSQPSYYLLVMEGLQLTTLQLRLYKLHDKLYPPATEFEVVSLGTSYVKEPFYCGLIRSAGLFMGLSEELVDLYFKGQSAITQDHIQKLFPGKYWRLNPLITSAHTSWDDISVSNLKYLQDTIQEYLGANSELIDTIVEHLHKPRSVFL